MRRRCEPLYDGDPSPTCGRVYDDERRWTICPHPRLDEPPPTPRAQESYRDRQHTSYRNRER